jgi:RNA 3'-terminal phosphate cyclase (ATP)
VLKRYGFYPPGGGRFEVSIEPATECRRLDIPARGPLLTERARALVVNLPPGIGHRELAIVKEQLGWSDDQLLVAVSTNAHSPGNVLTIRIESEHVTEIITGIGERGVRAETVAARAVAEALRYLEIDAPVGEHLADQLLIPMALGGGGSFLTVPLSLHTTTNIFVIKKFLDVRITHAPLRDRVWKVEVEKFRA